MLKAKIFLGAVAFFAVIGAGLALNARTATTIYTHKDGDAITKCTVPTSPYTTTNSGGELKLATFDSLQPCFETRVTLTE